MWRNAEVVEFVAWLREWNRRNRPSARLRGAGRGQLARERYGREALLVGFTTYSDVVLAR
jgi:erythromycin esterase-like protein